MDELIKVYEFKVIEAGCAPGSGRYGLQVDTTDDISPIFPGDLQSAFSALALSNSKHLSPAHRACPLGRRLAVLHGYCLRILHLPLGSTLHTVCLHFCTPSFTYLLSTIPHRKHYVNGIIILLLEGITVVVNVLLP
jgi:hypothetical protein